jgi:hypothetical protein
MILNDDPVFAETVTKAIGYLMDGASDDFRQELKRQRKGWLAIDDKSTEIRGYGIQIANTRTGEYAELADNALALRGSTATPSGQGPTPSETKLFGVAARYEAAGGASGPLNCSDDLNIEPYPYRLQARLSRGR